MKLKVFGGNIHVPVNGQVRAIVATTSQKKAAQLLGVSVYKIQIYFSISWNETELAVALSTPETVFVASGTMEKDFRRLHE